MKDWVVDIQIHQIIQIILQELLINQQMQQLEINHDSH